MYRMRNEELEMWDIVWQKESRNCLFWYFYWWFRNKGGRGKEKEIRAKEIGRLKEIRRFKKVVRIKEIGWIKEIERIETIRGK